MSTPVLDQLCVNLAYRLGDPRIPSTGEYVTISNLADGVTYTQKDRELYITQAVRLFLNTVGNRSLHALGYPKNYILTTEETFAPPDFVKELDISSSLARVLDVYYFDHKMMPATEDMLKRRHHVYWAKTPMYEVWAEGLIDPRAHMRLYIPRTLDTTVTIRYFRRVPLLTHDGPEDVLLSENVLPQIEQLAEMIGRRYHQEYYAALRHEYDADMQALKENR